MDGGMGTVDRASLAELEAKITELAGDLNAATYRWLTLIAEFDDRHGWSDGRLASCAHWLNFKVGLNLGVAREKVRVAHALAAVPKIAASMARGELSYSKVRALTRVATPATEDTLLMIALYGTAHHVEKTVRYFRQVQQAEELSREAHQHVGRAVDYWYDTDGSLVLKARLPALAGALLVKAIEHARSVVPTSATTAANVKWDAEDRRPQAAWRADALAAVAEMYLQNDHQSTSTADRFQVMVHVDAQTLQHRADGRCHIEHGPTIAIETVRRLTCDASLVRITENEKGEPLDVGRKTRTIPPAIRRALNARDEGCCFPGCTFRRFVDAHHVEHWADGGETKLSNLVTLCRAHHRLVHEGAVTVEARAGGGWIFRRPDGREFDTPGRQPSPPHDWLALRRAHAAQGLHIDPNTAATRWRGERMDYHLGIGILCHQAQRERQRHGALNQPGESMLGVRGDADGGDRVNHDHDHDHDHGHGHDVPAATLDDADDLNPGWYRGRDR